MNNGSSLNAGMVRVYDLLYRLGITSRYTGFFYTSFAVYLAAQEPECLLLVTKRLYPEVARRYNTNWRCVERNIRTVSELAWRENRAILEDMARRSLPRRPSATEFLAILIADLNSHVPEQE